METRDVLDVDGNVIGSLTLPDDTEEDTWTQKLAEYSQTPPPQNFPNVTPRQIRQALFINGITEDTINNAIAQLSDPAKTLAQIEWEYSTAFIRDNPIVEQIGLIIGWNSDQIDALWNYAYTL